MFIEEKKGEAEKTLINSVLKMTNNFFFDDWKQILVCNENYGNSVGGSFIVTFADGTFLEYNDLFMFSYYSREYLAHLACKFAQESSIAFDGKTLDRKNPSNITTLDLENNKKYIFNYYENLSDYKYASTPFAVWRYKKVGYKDYFADGKEIDKIIKKYNIVPEQVLKPMRYSVPLTVLLENLLLKNIYSIATYLPLNITKIYFHVDRVCGKTKFSIYIKTKEGKWIKEKNVQKVHGDYENQKLIYKYWGWLEDFDDMHSICKRTPYIALDYVYDFDSDVLNYSYDNKTPDNFDNELALLKQWEEKNFSKSIINKLFKKGASSKDSVIRGQISIKKSLIMPKKEEVEDVEIKLAQEFTGENIHDLIPQYFQNAYEIISTLLPSDWTKLYFYTEDDGNKSKQLGYVVAGEDYVPFGDLIKHNIISQQIYEAIMEQLKIWSSYFRNAFTKCEQEPWTVFYFSLNNKGNISTDFKYLDLNKKTYPNEISDLWAYKNLGIKGELPEAVLSRITPANVYTKLK